MVKSKACKNSYDVNSLTLLKLSVGHMLAQFNIDMVEVWLHYLTNNQETWAQL